jgi:hypothetical protein
MAMQQTTVVNLVAAVRVQLRDSEMLPRIEEQLKNGFGMIERLDNVSNLSSDRALERALASPIDL